MNRRRLPAADPLLLLCAVVATSCAAPIIKFAASDALTVAFWRVALAGGAIALLSVSRARWRVSLRQWGWTWVAGAFLGIHFWVWIASLHYTSVASSVLLVSTQPIWAAVMGRLTLREGVPWTGRIGIAIALGGSTVALGYGESTMTGDLLAVAGAVLAAGYMVIGRRERQRWEIFPYLARVYLSAAATLAVALWLTSTPIAPKQPADWPLLAALAVIPTGIGHSLYNYVLRRLPAYVVATGITGEPIGASLLALLFLGEVPPGRTLLAAPLVLAGVFLVIWSHRGRSIDS